MARMGERRGVQKFWWGNLWERDHWETCGKETIGKPRRRWEDNIKMDLQEVGGVCGDGWIWLRIGTASGHLRVR